MNYKLRFCTVVNCMDGRIQIPVINFLQKYFNAAYVDSITEAGPVKILANNLQKPELKSIHNRIKISVENHKSVGLAVVGHYNCAGNPTIKKNQIEQIKISVQNLKRRYPALNVIGLWVDKNWKVHKVKI